MWLFKVLRPLAFLIVYLLYSLESRGKNNIPEGQNFLLVCNHIHAFDPVFIALTSNFKFYTMSKAELFKNAFVAKILTALGAFPVKRMIGDVRAFAKAKKYLENGETVLIFPEGTRSKTGKLGTLKPGAAALCLSSGVPILPVQIIAPKGVKLWKKICVVYGDPIYPEQLGVKRGNRTTEALKEADEVILGSFLKLREISGLDG